MKRLMLNKANKKIAGVCAGIADYMEVDPIIIRAIFLFLFFVGGGGFLLYLIMLVLMPNK
jgi:phage shock protein PspC (stress-responsive transcriptional regulator)